MFARPTTFIQTILIGDHRHMDEIANLANATGGTMSRTEKGSDLAELMATAAGSRVIDGSR